MLRRAARTGGLALAVFVFFCLAQTAQAQPHGRGMFVTVLQTPQVLSGRKEISRVVETAGQDRVKTLFVQIYRANQAWFPSKVGDPSPYERCLKSAGQDPLALLIEQAHAAGIQVHAWVNLLSLANNKNAPLLKKYGCDILTRNLKKKTSLEDYRIDNQYFLEPGDPRVREELALLVDEILDRYPALDGIQFDYIRYPDKNPAYGFTRINVDRFKKATGCTTVAEKSPQWQAWKRRQVTELLALLVKKVRAKRPDMQVSATGCAPYVRASQEAFQEWPSWLESGLVDFVTVMTYSADANEFARYLADARKRVSDPGKLNFAVGAYVLGIAPATFRRQMRACEDTGAGECVIFHYGSLLDHPPLREQL
ncbi:MAG TPA: family 10 glycosylhydrolase [Candidatus Omnitrophota bacterium]|nr:family 10 glycosylhydrolase [Candidatus Omnitrophota bacterium]HRZ14339.1 family 10 glycosylhydrolase [Candidatus Omnitrophota bacterium]